MARLLFAAFVILIVIGIVDIAHVRCCDLPSARQLWIVMEPLWFDAVADVGPRLQMDEKHLLVDANAPVR